MMIETDETIRESIRDYVSLFGQLRPGGIPDIENWPGGSKALIQELGWRGLAKGVNDLVFSATDDSWFKVKLNGVSLLLPRFTMRTMRHCVFVSLDGTIDLVVEREHWEWMRSQLTPGSIFVDIGAATGAMTVPFALTVDGSVKIVAFEPSPRSRELLSATLAKNDINGVEVRAEAISNEQGEFSFIELPLELEGHDIPYISEASRLSVGDSTIVSGDNLVKVAVTTLDVMADQLGLDNYVKSVIKIDVEGFEENVLQGGEKTLTTIRPYLSIDIHTRPGSSESCGPEVKRILMKHRYDILEKGHVLIASPES